MCRVTILITQTCQHPLVSIFLSRYDVAEKILSMTNKPSQVGGARPEENSPRKTTPCTEENSFSETSPSCKPTSDYKPAHETIQSGCFRTSVASAYPRGSQNSCTSAMTPPVATWQQLSSEEGKTVSCASAQLEWENKNRCTGKQYNKNLKFFAALIAVENDY